MSRRNIQLPIDELVARYEPGESTRALGHAYGVGRTTIRRRLHAAGVKMRPCGARPGNKYGLKRGGPLSTNHGHLGTYDREGKRQYVHRACWEAYYGAIPDGCVVHHRDEDQLNNAIENLACMTQSEHMRLHRRMELYNVPKPAPKEADDGRHSEAD